MIGHFQGANYDWQKESVTFEIVMAGYQQELLRKQTQSEKKENIIVIFSLEILPHKKHITVGEKLGKRENVLWR